MVGGGVFSLFVLLVSVSSLRSMIRAGILVDRIGLAVVAVLAVVAGTLVIAGGGVAWVGFAITTRRRPR